ncbi:ATP-binding protein [Anaeromyxobacter oryzae]|uniref:hypothetical protein n=1 Tax=Anaeromyxobacter oryzae TaxID=2918170 RepID=UPI0020BE5048|nr:hypothetical protein [Anaeromyxobacter oryzae]
MSLLAAVLALAAGGMLVAALLAVAHRRLPRALRPLLGAVPDALGDAALLLDPRGVIAAANAAAGRLAGAPPATLAGASASTLFGADLSVLQRDAARGPAAGTIALAGGGVPARARAVVVRVSARPPLDLAVLRPEPAARPPPLPVMAPPPPPPRRAEGHADLGAVSAALRPPLSRAATAASMLRLLLTDGARAHDELDRLEAALRDLEGRVGALAAAGASGPGATRVLDLAALVRELLAAPTGPVRIRAALVPARALADEGRLRAALREVLRAAAEALPAGGELAVSVQPRGASAVLELASAALAADGGVAAIARALLGPEGGRVEVESVPGRGALCRIALPSAPRAALRPA